MVGFAEYTGHGMTFLVLTDKGTIVPRSQLRKVDEVPRNIRAEKAVDDSGSETCSGDEQDKNENVEFVETDTSPESIRFIPNEDLVGRAFLLDEEETGERTRATILKIYQDHIDKGRENKGLIKVRLKGGDEEFDDLITYNEVLDFIQDDYEVSDGIDTLYGVKGILDHYGPCTTNGPEEYNESIQRFHMEYSD
jgi:hypothetical protein